jgi:hypothetical protein
VPSADLPTIPPASRKPRVVSADGISVICWDEVPVVKTKVFVSYDFDHDKILYEFIIGQAKLPGSPPSSLRPLA